MHLRKLVPLSDLLAGSAQRSGSKCSKGSRGSKGQRSEGGSKCSATSEPHRLKPATPSRTKPLEPSGTPGTPGTAVRSTDGLQGKFLSELKAGEVDFLQPSGGVRVSDRRVGRRVSSSAFLPNQKNAKSQCDEQKAWLQSIAEKVAGRPVPVSIAVADAGAAARLRSRLSPGDLASVLRRMAGPRRSHRPRI